MPENRQIGHKPKPNQMPEQGINWLLVIGIDTYQHHRNLEKAVADAQCFADVMTSLYGFKLLVEPLLNENATQFNIREALGKCETLNENDRLIVFYAGHGWYKPKSELGYIVPTEARDNPHTDFIATSFITDIFKTIDARHILLIVDCCFGGSFGNRNTNVKEIKKVPKTLDAKRSRMVLSSGGIELVKDGYATSNNSPFMTPFLDILKSNEEPLTVLSNVFHLLRERTHYNTDQMPNYQPIPNLGHELGELAFAITSLESTEEKAYKAAVLADDIGVYEKFIKEFPTSAFKGEIKQLLKNKRARVEWEKIKNTDHIERLDDFIEYHGDNPLAILARQRIDELHELELEKTRIENALKIEQEQKRQAKETLRLQQEKERKEKVERLRLEREQAKKERVALQKQIEKGLEEIKKGYYNSHEEAFDFLLEHQSNKAFDKYCQYELAKMYNYGYGSIKKNEVEAIFWYEKAAEQGHLEAQKYLGDIYNYGYVDKVEVNHLEAAKWYTKAADKGDMVAQKRLGHMYELGKGVEKNYIEAIKWYQKSAEQGDSYGQYNFGNMYKNGKGFVQNYIEAIKWYQKSAEQGNEYGQFSLAEMYEDGCGVAQNYAESAKWYQKSAEQGNAFAQNKLGLMYEEGRGVPRNLNEAIRLYKLAAAQKHYYATASLKRLGYTE